MHRQNGRAHRIANFATLENDTSLPDPRNDWGAAAATRITLDRGAEIVLVRDANAAAKTDDFARISDAPISAA